MDITVATRPVEPDDLPRFARLWPRLSPETVYRRFHSPVRYLPPELVRRLVTVDHDRREALVAMSGDEVIGVARYDRSPTDPTTADVAVVVDDAWQGMGVGRQLLTQLSDLAAARGVRTVTAAVQEDNDRMVGMIRRLLPGSAFRVDDHVYAVRSPLGDPAQSAPTPTPVTAAGR
jgi:GNAT superfamily N-acetyltransferase